MAAYYNEIDPFNVEWLRWLIKNKAIADGDVDDRSIEEVTAADLKRYRQCHFFAGIGVWSYALRSAGWRDDREVWSGSCPCQSFSLAGERKGFDDKRNLWPHWIRLIRKRKPAVVFGEQVSSAVKYGWIDVVQADLEASRYAVGKAVLGAACVGAPIIRQRLYFLARRIDGGRVDRLGGTGSARLERHPGNVTQGSKSGWIGARQRRSFSDSGFTAGDEETFPLKGFWRDADWIRCTDGLFRSVEPTTFPMAARTPSHMGCLRGYGNAINAETAKAFIGTCMEIL